MNIKIFNKIKEKQSILSKDQIEGKSVELLPRSRSHHCQDSANFRLVDLFFLLLLLLQYFSRKLHSQQGDFQAGPTISIKIQIKLHYNSIYKKYV